MFGVVVDVFGLIQRNCRDLRRYQEPLNDLGEGGLVHQFLGRHERVPSKDVGSNLHRSSVAQASCVGVCPVLEQQLAKFVRERAALPHRVPGARNADVAHQWASPAKCWLRFEG